MGEMKPAVDAAKADAVPFWMGASLARGEGRGDGDALSKRRTGCRGDGTATGLGAPPEKEA